MPAAENAVAPSGPSVRESASWIHAGSEAWTASSRSAAPAGALRRRRLGRELAEDGVGEGREPGAPRLLDGLDRLVDRREGGDPLQEEQLVGGEHQLGVGARVDAAEAAGRVAQDARVEPRQDAQRAVHELRGEGPVARLELQRARHLGVEHGRREGAVLEHANEDRGGDAACCGERHERGNLVRLARSSVRVRGGQPY